MDTSNSLFCLLMFVCIFITTSNDKENIYTNLSHTTGIFVICIIISIICGISVFLCILQYLFGVPIFYKTERLTGDFYDKKVKKTKVQF